MSRIVYALLAVCFFTTAALAETVDGTLIAIDPEKRTITLETGAILELDSDILLDGLQPGQVLRVNINDGTVIANAVDILAQTPAPIEEPDTSSDSTSEEP